MASPVRLKMRPRPTAQADGADGHHDGRAGVGRGHAAHEAVGVVHGDAADDVVAHVQRGLDRQPDAALGVLDQDGVVDLRQLVRIERHVDRGTDHLHHFAYVHCSVLLV